MRYTCIIFRCHLGISPGIQQQLDYLKIILTHRCHERGIGSKFLYCIQRSACIQQHFQSLRLSVVNAAEELICQLVRGSLGSGFDEDSGHLCIIVAPILQNHIQHGHFLSPQFRTGGVYISSQFNEQIEHLCVPFVCGCHQSSIIRSRFLHLQTHSMANKSPEKVFFFFQRSLNNMRLLHLQEFRLLCSG